MEASSNDTTEETGKGNVWFHLLPRPRVTWEAFITSADPDFPSRAFRHYLDPNLGIRLSSILDSGWLAETIGTAEEFAMPERPLDLEDGEFSFSSILDSPFEIGNREGLEEIRFSLVNFPFQKGNALVQQYPEVEGPDTGVRPHRLTLGTDDGWTIDIDARENLREVWEQSKRQESYAFTHVGRLRKTDGSSFHFDQAQDILNMLYWFLSFMTGRRVGVVLPVGYEKSSQPPVFMRWDCRVTQVAKGSMGWYDETHSADGLAGMFRSFQELWRDAFWKEITLRTIYTYTHAQEGTWADVLMAQSSLETLAWAVLVEKKGQRMIADPQHRLSKSQFEKLNAADRLRKLLRWAGATCSPPSASDLLGPAALHLIGDPCNLDGPRAVTWTRNKIAHPKPNGASMPPSGSYFECGWTLLGYIELTMLKLLSFHGFYADRMERYAPEYGSFGNRKPYWRGANMREVPWVTQTTSPSWNLNEGK